MKLIFSFKRAVVPCSSVESLGELVGLSWKYIIIYQKFFFSNSRNKHSKLATPIFAEQGCCFSSFQLAQKVFVWTHWVMSALLYMCRLICACVTAIYLMWLIWGFFGISKVATIRLKRPYISAQYIFECNIFPPAFQLKNENNMSGSGSLYFVAPLQFSYTAKGLQCLR